MEINKNSIVGEVILEVKGKLTPGLRARFEGDMPLIRKYFKIINRFDSSILDDSLIIEAILFKVDDLMGRYVDNLLEMGEFELCRWFIGKLYPDTSNKVLLFKRVIMLEGQVVNG